MPRAAVYCDMNHAQTRFEALLAAFGDDLYRIAYWLTRDRARAEDLVQETFLRAWRALDTLRDEHTAKAWLITILRRELAREYARYAPQFEDAELDDLPGAEAPSIEALWLRRALHELPAEYAEPLLLQVLGGYRCEEIATALGIGTGAVMTRLFRARQRLRAALLRETPMPAVAEEVA
jgi:RNA polymerase sigma-70 factor (ECF subfamily)